MSKTFKFEVVTPTGVFYSDEVNYISFEAIDGEMGILSNHAPLLAANKPCTLTIEKDKNKRYAFISEGFIEVTKDKVSAVVDFAGWSNEINTEKVLRDKAEAEEELESQTQDLGRQTELKASIERAKAALKTSSIRD